jgi:hypothetical protein
VLGFLPSDVASAPSAPYVPPQEVHTVEKPQIEAVSPVLCNCYLFVKERYHGLPRASQVIASTTRAFAPVAVFMYSGVQHFALVESMGIGFFTISETNYKKCQKTTRDIKFDDPALVGFYSPE